MSNLSPVISGKQLEILKETIPRLSRLAVFGTSAEPGNTQALKDIELAAGVLGVQVQYLEVRVPKDLEIAFQARVRVVLPQFLRCRTPSSLLDENRL